MEQHSSRDPWGWLSIFSSGSRAFHASGGEPKWTQRWHSKEITKRQVKGRRSGYVGREHNKTITCPNSAGLLFECISSLHVFLLTDSELQGHRANGKLSPEAKMEAVWLYLSMVTQLWTGNSFFICNFELTDALLCRYPCTGTDCPEKQWSLSPWHIHELSAPIPVQGQSCLTRNPRYPLWSLSPLPFLTFCWKWGESGHLGDEVWAAWSKHVCWRRKLYRH